MTQQEVTSQGGIILPSLADVQEVADLRGAAISRDTLEKHPDLELLNVFTDTKVDMDERFDAALILRGREKSEALIKDLLKLVEVSVQPDLPDGTSGYTYMEKKTAILAAVALQGQIAEMPNQFSAVKKWVSSYYDFQRKKGWPRKKGKETDTEKVEQTELSEEQIQAGVHNDKLHRAMVMLGSPRTEEAQAILIQVIMHRHSPSSAVTMALQGLGGVNNENAAGILMAAVSLLDLSSLNKYTALNILGLYRPESKELEEYLRGVKEVTEVHNLRAQLSLEQGSGDLERLIDRALNPTFSTDQAELAQERIAANSWRPLMHLRDQESLLFPLGDNALFELAPPGSLGDLTTWRNIAM